MIVQRSDAWFLERLGCATGSKFHDIMAGDKRAGWKNYRAQLVAERLTGKKLDTFQSAEMLWGVENEALAKLHYKLRTRNDVEDCGFFRHDTLAAGASPDGLVGEDGLIEIKAPNTATHIETLRTGKVPNVYVSQVQGQLWITGRTWADFISFDSRLPQNACVFMIRVLRDEEYIKKLESEVTRFLVDVEQECEYVRNYKGVL